MAPGGGRALRPLIASISRQPHATTQFPGANRPMQRVLGITFAALLAPVMSAQAAQFRADYTVTLAGLLIGNGAIEGSFEDSRYDVKLSGRMTGVVGALSGGSRGGATARGTVAGTRLVSSGFSASAASGSSSRTVQVGVANGNVTSVSIEPPFEERPGRVPLTEASKRNIVDPVSGLVAVAADPAKPYEPANCSRTVPVFDGSQRFDVVLNYAGTRVVRKPGFTGNVLVCSIRYVPIAGHRVDRPSVQFMRDNRDMSVWLAPVEGTRMLVPIRISLETMLGTSVVEAQSWQVSGGERRAEAR